MNSKNQPHVFFNIYFAFDILLPCENENDLVKSNLVEKYMSYFNCNEKTRDLLHEMETFFIFLLPVHQL